MLDLKKLDKVFKSKGLSLENPDGTRKDPKKFIEETLVIWRGLSEKEKTEFRIQYEKELSEKEEIEKEEQNIDMDNTDINNMEDDTENDL